MAYSDNFPAQRPVFMADFANGGRIDPRATFTRASTGSYFGTEKVLSSENLLAYSSDLSNSFWTKTYVSVTGGQTDPSGGTGAYKLTETTDNADHRFYHLFPTAPTGEVTYSFYVKYIGRQWIYLRTKDGTGTNRHIWFDIQNGIAGTAETNVTGTISASGNGFYKITVTVASGISGGQSLVIGGAAADGDGAGYTGSGADAFAFWGINMSTLGETVLNETSGSIHREYQTKLQTAASGAARFEHSATDGQSVAKGILIEGQSTNLALYSEQFGSGSYHAFRLHVDANSAIAPDGTLTADTLRENDAASNTHGLYQDIAVSGTTAHTVSFYAKAAGRNHLAIRFDATNGVFGNDWVYFNLSTGAVGAKDADITASIESCGNGWYRCIATRTALAAATGRVVIYLADADNSSAYTGNSYSGVLAWGFSFEANSFASSYLKTEAATVTRAAESLSVATANIGYTGGPVSVVGEFSFLEDEASPVGTWNASPRLMTIAGSSDEVEILRNTGDGANTLASNVEVNGTDYLALATSTNTGAGIDYKVGLSLQSGSIKGCMNGGAVGENTNAVFPDISSSTLYVGSINTTQGHVNGYCKRIAVYSEPLSSTNLQALTS